MEPAIRRSTRLVEAGAVATGCGVGALAGTWGAILLARRMGGGTCTSMGCHQSAGLLIFLLVAFVTVPLLGALAGATLAGKLAGGDDALLVAGFSILVGVPTLVLVVMSSDLSFVADVALPFGMALVFGTAAAVTRLAAEASKQRGSYGRPPLTVLLVAPWIACFVAILVNVD